MIQRLLIGLLWLVLLNGTVAFAQEATAEVTLTEEAIATLAPVLGQVAFTAGFDPTSTDPLLGEPVEMSLVVTVPVGYEVIFPEFGLDWGETFSVTEVGEVEIEETGDNRVFSLPMTVVAWRTGELETPVTVVEYAQINSEDTSRLQVQPLTFQIPGTLDAVLELRTSRDTLLLAYPLWFVLMLLGILLVLLGIVVWRVVVRVRSANGLGTQRISKTLVQRTVQSLTKIRSESPDIITQYVMMGDGLRGFIQELLGVPTQDLTTNELMEQLENEQLMSDGRQKELRYLLEQADLAKFAPAKVYAPKELSLVQLAVQWVQTTAREANEQ